MSGMWKTGGLTPAARLSVCNYGVDIADYDVARGPDLLRTIVKPSDILTYP